MRHEPTAIEAFADARADATLRPLEVSSALGPVLATPAYAAYGAGLGIAFTLGIASDACCHTDADELSSEDLVEGASADQLLSARVTGLR